MWPLLRVLALPLPISCPPILTAGETLKLQGHSADTRPSVTLSERSRYGTWTQNLLHHPPHASGTADALGVATVNDHPCRAGSTWPDAYTPGGWGADRPHCCSGRDQPS